MQRLSLKSGLLGLSLVAGLAAQASAAVIYGTGFDGNVAPLPGAGPYFTPGVGLAGQNGWTGFVNPTGTSNVPLGGTFAYTPGFNPQYALITALNNAAGSSGYYAPTHAAYTPGVTGTDQAVAITFSMNVLGGYGGATSQNAAFFGVTAFNGADEIASLGLSQRTGDYVLPAGATVLNTSPQGLGTLGLGSYRGFELLLNYPTQTWSIYSQLTPGVGAYTLDAYGAFANAATTFTDADLASFNLGTGVSNGYAQFDDYLVQTVPEPTVLAAGAASITLLLGRRRRMV